MNETQEFASIETKQKTLENSESKGQRIKRIDVALMIFFHVVALYFTQHLFHMKLLSIIWIFIVGGIGDFGVTAGAHRLWSHRSYKVKLPLKLILLFCYATAGQHSLIRWVKDHRIHHKFSDTDADPHNSKRGFFYSHIGWLMLTKHPETVRKQKLIDLSDITDDPTLVFYNKYFVYIKILCCFILPTLVPVCLWNEQWKYAITSQIFIRYVINLHSILLINSAAHMWGQKPYDERIKPAENILVAVVALGEGWHNYHHVFPWDYKAAELGDYKFNFTTMWLDFFARIGWAYDRKTPSKQLVRKTMKKYGDGSRTIEEVPCDEPSEKSE